MYQRRGFDGQTILGEHAINERARDLFNEISQRFSGTTAIVATAHRHRLVPAGEFHPSTCATELAAWGITAAEIIEASRQRNREREHEATTDRRHTA